MKFGQVLEHNKKNIFIQISCRKCGRKTSFRPLFVFQQSFICGKSKWSAAHFQYISIVRSLAYNKNKLYKTLDYWSGGILHIDLLEKRLWIVSPPHFVYDSPRKMFLMPYSINQPNFIVWLCLLLLRCWWILVLQFFVSQAVMS